MRKLLLPVIALFAVILLVQSCAKSTKVIVSKPVKVQGLFSITGNWSSLGITSRAALELAQEDINKYLAQKDAKFHIEVAISDTKLETETARLLFVAAKDLGVKFFIGPQSSAELATIKPEADAHDVLVVSQSSTAGSLAIAGDNIFRFCPSDKIEGAASGATIFKQGSTGLVTVARDDAGNKGLQTSTGAAFAAKGGEVAAIAPYPITTTNYASVIASIKTEVARLTVSKGTGKVAVYLASFDEGIELFKLASAEPTLNSIKWYGGDGVVLSTALLTDPVVAEFAIKTGFFAPSFGLPDAYKSKWEPLAARIKAKTGTDPDAYALAAYDALWTIAYTLEGTDGSTTDFAKIKTLFVAEANKDTGVTGADALDAAGDRASGTFDYFGILKDGASYKWTLVGKSE
ncbi:ABC transporter substrate-binding protein [Mucilaginibacter gilvus]|uniref:Amino acid ABC transporter substrate-binding protein n=1 Tax=Mucilaginibacter gilvus TaxID=2305909 RepID=A0A444MTU3_9SPHI|nr:ABC transporter substrate-binding protein [Mucilaginibacter gilvus]RWY57031.1 amino acid ABC transporter substrate-binding protein [Mucilaginibacter gilvus]